MLAIPHYKLHKICTAMLPMLLVDYIDLAIVRRWWQKRQFKKSLAHLKREIIQYLLSEPMKHLLLDVIQNLKPSISVKIDLLQELKIERITQAWAWDRRNWKWSYTFYVTSSEKASYLLPFLFLVWLLLFANICWSPVGFLSNILKHSHSSELGAPFIILSMFPVNIFKVLSLIKESINSIVTGL